MDREPLMLLIIQASEKTTEILYISGSKGGGRGQVIAFGRGASDAVICNLVFLFNENIKLC